MSEAELLKKLNDILRKENRIWKYEEAELKSWIEEFSKYCNGTNELCEKMGVYKDFVRRLTFYNDINFNFKSDHKTSFHFKAIYQNYDWCYHQFITLGKSANEIAQEFGFSKRVIEKWCGEKHNLNNRTRRNHLKLNEIQEEIVVGSLLGDGHIDRRENNPIFIVSHAENQKEYLFWKYSLFEDLCNKEPSKIDEKDTAFGKKILKKQKTYRMCTRSISDLIRFRKLSKSEIISRLSEFSFSIFVLDDGYRGKYWSICVAGLSHTEKEELMEKIKQFNITGKFDKEKSYIKFTAEGSNKIDEIILKHIPKDLDIIQYKILNNKRMTKIQQERILTYDSFTRT